LTWALTNVTDSGDIALGYSGLIASLLSLILIFSANEIGIFSKQTTAIQKGLDGQRGWVREVHP
jgi:hypothetical protein